ncbi:MAG: hypothetical protein LBC18_10790 [Opitutaceae bacterium]|nr:hypothetical protein [Opitutaceae bacterium]
MLKKITKYALPVAIGLFVGAAIGDKIPIVNSLAGKVRETIDKARQSTTTTTAAGGAV